jgi:hypothetical protein
MTAFVWSKKDAKHTDGKCGLDEHLLKVVDKDAAAQGSNAGDLLLPRRLKKNVLARKSKATFGEKPMCRHPIESGGAEVDSRRIAVPMDSLVTDDKNLHLLVPATDQKLSSTLDQNRLGHAGAVDAALQALPRDFAMWPLPAEMFSEGPLSPAKGGADQAHCTGSGQKHLVIAGQRIVQVDTDPPTLLWLDTRVWWREGKKWIFPCHRSRPAPNG